MGADLALPPALLAEVIEHDASHGDLRQSGAYFGLWGLIAKLNLALAAGLALPLLAALGYQSSEANTATGINGLLFCYALLPCSLKVIASYLLWRSPALGRRPAQPR